MRRAPKYFAVDPDGNKVLKESVYSFYKEVSGEKVELKNNFVVQRGAYVIAAVLDDSISSNPVQIKGLYIDLFDKALTVISQKKINPGEQAFLYDLRKITEKS